MKKTVLEPRPSSGIGKMPASVIKCENISKPCDFRHLAHVGLDYVDLINGDPPGQLSPADEKSMRIRMPIGTVMGSTQEMTFSVHLDEPPACRLSKRPKSQERIRKGLRKDPEFVSHPAGFQHLVHIEDTRSNARNFVAPNAVDDRTVCKMFHVIDRNIETKTTTKSTVSSPPKRSSSLNEVSLVSSPASNHQEIEPVKEVFLTEFPSCQTRPVVDHDIDKNAVIKKTAQKNEHKLPVLLDGKDTRIDESLLKNQNSHSSKNSEFECENYDRSGQHQMQTTNLCDRPSVVMEQRMSNNDDEESTRLSTHLQKIPSKDSFESTDFRQNTFRTLPDRNCITDSEAPSDRPQLPMAPPRSKPLASNDRSESEKASQKENALESKIEKKRNIANEISLTSSPDRMGDRELHPNGLIKSTPQLERSMKTNRPKAEIAGRPVVMRPPRQMAAEEGKNMVGIRTSVSMKSSSDEVMSAIGALDNVLSGELSLDDSSLPLSNSTNGHGCDHHQLFDHPDHNLFFGNGNEKLSVKELTKKLNDSGKNLLFGVHGRGFPKPTLAKEILAEDAGNQGDYSNTDVKNDNNNNNNNGTTDEEQTPAPSALSKVQHIGINMFGGCDGRSLADIIAEKKTRNAKQPPALPMRNKKPILINPRQLESRIPSNSDNTSTENKELHQQLNVSFTADNAKNSAQKISATEEDQMNGLIKKKKLGGEIQQSDSNRARVKCSEPTTPTNDQKRESETEARYHTPESPRLTSPSSSHFRIPDQNAQLSKSYEILDSSDDPFTMKNHSNCHHIQSESQIKNKSLGKSMRAKEMPQANLNGGDERRQQSKNAMNDNSQIVGDHTDTGTSNSANCTQSVVNESTLNAKKPLGGNNNANGNVERSAVKAVSKPVIKQVIRPKTCEVITVPGRESKMSSERNIKNNATDNSGEFKNENNDEANVKWKAVLGETKAKKAEVIVATVQGSDSSPVESPPNNDCDVNKGQQGKINSETKMNGVDNAHRVDYIRNKSPLTASNNHQAIISNNSDSKSSLSVSVNEDKRVQNTATPPIKPKPRARFIQSQMTKQQPSSSSSYSQNAKPNAQRSDVQQRPIPLPRSTIPYVPKEDISESNPKLKNAQKNANDVQKTATEELVRESGNTIEMTKTNNESNNDSESNQSTDEVRRTQLISLSRIRSGRLICESQKDDWVLRF